MPANINKGRFYQLEQSRVLTALESLVEPHQYSHTLSTFLSYYNRIGSFKDTDQRWNHKDQPLIFWQLYMDEDRPLAMLAIRMLKTIANSVPSERAFSALKATHTITRNRLTAERVNKLLFIQINQRVLKRSNPRDSTIDESAKIEAVDPATDSDYELQPIDALTAN